jgi:transcriptional regulator with XRE-family HTH domain
MQRNDTFMFDIRTRSKMRAPHDVAIARIRQLRKRNGYTQQQLADQLNLLGAQTDRAAVAKVELGQRGLSLNEAFQYAMALNVAPVHLFAPTDDDDPISLGPNLTVSPHEMRRWVRGQQPLGVWQDERIYYSEVPREEFEVTQRALREFQEMPWRVWDADESEGEEHS